MTSAAESAAVDERAAATDDPVEKFHSDAAILMIHSKSNNMQLQTIAKGILE